MFRQVPLLRLANPYGYLTIQEVNIATDHIPVAFSEEQGERDSVLILNTTH